MRFILALLVRLLTSRLRPDSAELEIKLLAARQQPAVYRRSALRPRLRLRDRLFRCRLSRLWSGWKQALVVVEPATVIAWRRRRLREFWTKLSSKRGPGRPPVATETQDLTRRMSELNVTWGSPRIRSELKMLGIDVAQSTVEGHMVKRPKPASPTWRAFLANHVGCLASIDFFTVPTVRHRVLKSYLAYYHCARCPMALAGDAPEHREVQRPEMGKVIALPEVGGIHHRYVHRAA
jgi:hypothetical protein